MKKITLITLLFILHQAANAINISTIQLPGGAIILQATGAVAGNTAGGIATADTRTIYFFSSDFGDPSPNTHDFNSNMNWPYVYVNDTINVDPGITANITLANDANGNILIVQGNPVYQFINDLTPTDANGNFGPWFFIQSDGTATQSTVPEPSAYGLLIGSLLFGILQFLRRRHHC